MATESTAAGLGRIDAGKWLTGAGAGVVGTLAMLLVHVGFGVVDPADLTVVPVLGNLLIGAVIGVAYAGIASIGRLREVAADPRTGAALGLAYGLVFWGINALNDPLAAALAPDHLFPRTIAGVAIGLVYAFSPYTRGP